MSLSDMAFGGRPPQDEMDAIWYAIARKQSIQTLATRRLDANKPGAVKVQTKATSLSSTQVPLLHTTTTRQTLGAGGGGVPVAETAMVTYALPAATLGANDGLRIIVWGATAGATGNKTTRIRWNGVGGTQCAIATVAAGVNPFTRLEAYIFNRNATNSQFASGMGIDTAAIDTVTGVIAAVDTTAAVNIVISGQLADNADAVLIDLVVIEKLSGTAQSATYYMQFYPIAGNVEGYRIYKSTINNSAVATAYDFIPQTPNIRLGQLMTWQDTTTGTPFYWVAAVSPGGTEGIRIPMVGAAAPVIQPATVLQPDRGAAGGAAGRIRAGKIARME